MFRAFRTTLPALLGAALLASCAEGDALTSPIGTTVATVHPAASAGSRYVVVFDGAPPAGFLEQVAGLGGTVEWVHRRGHAVGVAGLSDEAAVSLLRTRGVAGVRRVE